MKDGFENLSTELQVKILDIFKYISDTKLYEMGFYNYE